jgi:hypothetical protein
VTVRADSKLVRIYKRGQLIKTHPRKPVGSRSTDANDYPSEKATYAMRDIDGLITRAKRRGHNLGEFARQLLAGTLPWANLRQAQKMMRLADKYGNERADAACRRALDYDVINVRRVQTILESSLERASGPAQEQRSKATQQDLSFLRDSNSFTH